MKYAWMLLALLVVLGLTGCGDEPGDIQGLSQTPPELIRTRTTAPQAAAPTATETAAQETTSTIDADRLLHDPQYFEAVVHRQPSGLPAASRPAPAPATADPRGQTVTAATTGTTRLSPSLAGMPMDGSAITSPNGREYDTAKVFAELYKAERDPDTYTIFRSDIEDFRRRHADPSGPPRGSTTLPAGTETTAPVAPTRPADAAR